MTSLQQTQPPLPGSDAFWLDAIPEGEFRYRLGTRPGDAAQYFAPTAAHHELLAERSRWLQADPARYAAVLPAGVPLLEEAIRLAVEWQTVQPSSLESLHPAHDPLARCLALGMAWEPDFALLRPDDAGKMILVAGCICFPSFWRLGDKIGRPIDVIHGVVPGLNDRIGASIDALLQRMKPGASWKRSNWSLTRTNELNQYPERGVTRLEAECTAETIWLRMEHQALVSLPDSRGVLFGIRIQNVAFQDLLQRPEVAGRLRRTIESMPADAREYKIPSAAVERVLTILKSASSA